jgi:hypothetical protein
VSIFFQFVPTLKHRMGRLNTLGFDALIPFSRDRMSRRSEGIFFGSFTAERNTGETPAITSSKAADPLWRK